MQNNGLLKLLLATQAIALGAYTVAAFKNEGANLFSIFLGNIQSLNWNGQFNLDFTAYLTLSGLWIMWRNRFTPSSILFGTIAAILGIIVFAPYLLYLLTKEKGSLTAVLIGDR